MPILFQSSLLGAKAIKESPLGLRGSKPDQGVVFQDGFLDIATNPPDGIGGQSYVLIGIEIAHGFKLIPYCLLGSDPGFYRR